MKIGKINNKRKEEGVTDNSVRRVDYFDNFGKYWGGIDNQFKAVRKSDLVYYLDGHMSISTSNHLDMLTFAESLRSSWCAYYPIGEITGAVNTLVNQFVKHPLAVAISNIANEFCPNNCYHSNDCVQHSTNPNVPGFDQRKAQGYIAGGNLYARLAAENIASMDTIDIVCHSMGFAYAQGVIEALKELNVEAGFGGYYIIAPENACSGEVNVNDWQQVWQYGSNENVSVTPKWRQDGVAPQCPVGNIGTRRAYIPDDVVQGFISSHSIGNYGWIFSKLNKDDRGYVTPRK